MRREMLIAVLLVACIGVCQSGLAGMPALLPSSWTADNPHAAGVSGRQAVAGNDARWQAISFFVVCVLVSAQGVMWLWNSLGKEFPFVPRIGYSRALMLVVLWGAAFVVVLTMISGARELMTPGAWKKQGWTYTLEETPSVPLVERRRESLERLRTSLWQYAALHEGKFPSDEDPAVDAELWSPPNWPGVRYLYIDGQSAETAGKLLVCEPAIEGPERFVLLTNGFLGTMRTPEIERLLNRGETP